MLGVLKLKCYYSMLPLQQLFDWFILLKAFAFFLMNHQRLDHIFELARQTFFFYGRHRIYQYNEDNI